MKKADKKSAEKYIRKKQGGILRTLTNEEKADADRMLVTGLFIKIHR